MTLTYNIETWTEIGKKGMEKMEQIQAASLKKVWTIKGNSVLGYLIETGVWSVEEIITYKRLHVISEY